MKKEMGFISCDAEHAIVNAQDKQIETFTLGIQSTQKTLGTTEETLDFHDISQTSAIHAVI
jgi:hypothetical protein